MKIDVKLLFLILLTLCLVTYADGFWGRGSSSRSRSPTRSSGGWFSRRSSSTRSTPSRTRTSRRWFIRRTPVSRSTASKSRTSRRWFIRRTPVSRSTASKTRTIRGWLIRRTSVSRSTSSRTRTSRRWFIRRTPVSRSTASKTRTSRRWLIRRTPVSRSTPSRTRQSKSQMTSSGVTKNELRDMKKVITKYETIGGKPNLKVYKDSKGRNAIGVGFDLDQPDAKKVFQKTLPGVSFDKVKAGKQSITAKQASKLLDHEMKSKIATARRIVKTFDKAPKYVKTAVVNAVYRGELKSTHKTVKLMNEGKWKQAAKEYVNHKGYKDASKPGSKSPGIKTRMDYNAKQFEKYGKELEKKG